MRKFGQMKSAHDKIVRLADKLRMTSNTRGEFNSMRKEVLAELRKSLANQKNATKNPWKFSLGTEIKTGSFYRQTATENQSDVDVVIALNYKSNNPSEVPNPIDVLRFVKSIIPKKFDPKIKKRAVVVHSKSGNKSIAMDIVPAVKRVGKNSGQSTWWNGISKINSKDEWVLLNPTHQKKVMEKLKRRQGQRDDPSALIICLKRWRDLHEKKGAPCELPSYVLEVLVWEDYKEFPEAIDDLTDRFNRILKKFNRINTKGVSFSKMMGDSHRPKGSKVATGKPLLHDPSNTSVNLVEHIDRQDLSWWGERATKASSNDISFGKIFQ